MSSEALKQRLLKLLALAKRGEGGEAANAQRFLEKLLAKNGMTLNDLEGDSLPLTRATFVTKGPDERRLLMQLLFKVTGNKALAVYRLGNVIDLDLTKPQILEAKMLFELYRPALKKHLKKQHENAFLAFIHKNHIYGETKGEDEDEDESQEQRKGPSQEDIAAIRAMMAGTQQVPTFKAIECKA